MKLIALVALLAAALPALALAQGEAQAPQRAGAARAGRGPATPTPISIPDAPKLNFVPVESPTLPAGMPAGGVAGVVLTKDGTLYSYERTTTPLVQWDSGGHFVRGYLQDTTSRPHGMRLDADGNFWLTDGVFNTVTKVSRDGKVLMQLGTKGQAGTWDEATGAHLFNQPNDIGFGPTGDIFVATGHGGPDPRIVRFDKNGKFIKTWSLQHDGIVPNIHTIVVDKNGLIYAGDRGVNQIRVFDADGKHLRDIQMNNLVCGLYIDAKGGLWMAAGQDGMILKLDWSGKVLGWTGKVGKGPNEYGEAHYIAMSPDLKTMYVADTNNQRIQKLVATDP